MKTNQNLLVAQMKNNMGLRALALLIAVGLWLFVNSENNITVRNILVPVDYKNKPADKYIVSEYNRQVNVTLRGPAFLVNRIEASQPVFKVELPESVGSKFKTQLSKDDLDIAPPVQIVEIEPSELEVSLVNRAKVELPVDVPTIGILSKSLRLEGISIEPSIVLVNGPENELGSLKKVETEPLDLSEIGIEFAARPFIKVLRLTLPGKLSDFPSASTVTIQVRLTGIEAERSFESIPIEIRSPAGEIFSTVPTVVTVRVAGLKRRIEELNLPEIAPFIRVDKGTKSDSPKAVQIDLPQGISLVSISPERVKIRRVSSR